MSSTAATPLYTIQTQGELHPFVRQEWLLTNGLGAFAHGTVVGCNTRRYHGLFIAAVTPPVGRIMMLNRIGELIYLDGRTDEFFELSINQFRNSFHPRGDRFLRRFEKNGTVRWEYDVQGVKITKEIQLAWKKNLLGVRYTIEPEGDRQVEMHLLPFVSMRDFHALRHANEVQYRVEQDQWELSVSTPDQTLHLHSDAGHFERRGDWWYGHTLAIETERGMDDTEDLYVPGELIHKCAGRSTITLWASVGQKGPFDWDAELARRPDPMASLAMNLPREGCPGQIHLPASTTIQRLVHSAADFIVDRVRPDGKPGTTVIAGYPWFADWGRDTMISFPGLFLTTRRYQEACEVLSVFAEYVSEGMIPNRFDDYNNEPHYNTVDASLWFIHACYEYLGCTADKQTFESKLLPACRAIIDGYKKGTRYHIRMDPHDGLITQGQQGTQLTWMDAKWKDIVFTPRHGKAVEINALWYHDLMLLGETELAEKVRRSFVDAFWYNPFRGLYDVVDGKHRDPLIRPNQIFAVSLPHSPLNRDQQHAVVEVVRRELLIPFGLRTLARSEPGYCGRYCGPVDKRDQAYHNGTVWPWLIGPFLDAYLRVNDNSADAQRQCRVWLQPLIDEMCHHCIGSIAECYEADEPHRPVAAPAQAWSVSEVLRLAARLGM